MVTGTTPSRKVSNDHADRRGWMQARGFARKLPMPIARVHPSLSSRTSPVVVMEGHGRCRFPSLQHVRRARPRTGGYGRQNGWLVSGSGPRSGPITLLKVPHYRRLTLNINTCGTSARNAPLAALHYRPLKRTRAPSGRCFHKINTHIS